jgi:hypothetical protein
VAGTTGGQSGVFVIPSGNLAAAPAFVSSAAATAYLAYGEQVTVSGSNVVTALSPATYMYAAIDNSNNIHVYGLNLASSSTPEPVQIGSLSLPLTSGAAINTVICDSRQSQTNILQPSTMFVVVHIAGTGGCNTTGDVWEVVHYTDSSGTAPAVANITSTQFNSLFGPGGALTGLELLDAGSGNLYLYPDDTFTSPATLVTGVTGASVLFDADDVVGGVAFSGNELFLAVTTASGSFLYRLPHASTTATKEYTATGSLSGSGIGDGTNMYFVDTTSATTSTSTFWAEPLGGGAPTELYSVSYPVSVSYDLLGANASVLVFYETTISGGAITSNLLNVPVGSVSSSATSIGGPYNGSISADSSFLQPTTAGDASSRVVFLNVIQETSGGGTTTINYSSEVLTPTGTVKQSLTTNSVYPFAATGPLSGSVLQITGITDTNGGYGGGSFNDVSLATLNSTALTTTGGAAYQVPAGDISGLAGLANTIGAGVIAPRTGAGASQGAAYDLSKDLIVPISLTNTSITLFN